MDATYQVGPDVHVLPTHLALPGVGVLPINAFVLLADEPVLVDTGIGFDGPDFLDALSSIVDPSALRWVWLTHDDADHVGSIEQVLDLAPQARLVTNGFIALRMASWWHVPLDRVHAIREGDTLHVGDRTLRAIMPPLFDNPLSTGFIDESTGSLFSVDAFGAILPEPTQSADDVHPDALAGGMLGGRRPTRRGPTSSTGNGSARCWPVSAVCSRPGSSRPTCRPPAGRRSTSSSSCWPRCPTRNRSSPPATRSSSTSWPPSPPPSRPEPPRPSPPGVRPSSRGPGVARFGRGPP